MTILVLDLGSIASDTEYIGTEAHDLALLTCILVEITCFG